MDIERGREEYGNKITMNNYKIFMMVWGRVLSELLNEEPTLCPEDTKRCLIKINSLLYKLKPEDLELED